MGWNNPPIPWSEFEARLSDGRPRNQPAGADGGDSPAWSRKRQPYSPPAQCRTPAVVPYAELHSHSNFSFLDGASHPEELAEEAARLGLEALALTDHDGMYGVVRFAEAARAVGIPTVFGAELSLDLPRTQTGVADPEGRHLVVLCCDPAGYARLCRAITLAQLRGEKGRPLHDIEELAALAGGHWLVLTGCRKGTVTATLAAAGPSAARQELDRLIALFGREHVAVELIDHGDPLDSHRNDALAELGARAMVETIATNNVHYATPSRHRLAAALAAVRARRSLTEHDGWLPPSGAAHLRSGAEQARRFARYPGVVERAAMLGRQLAFDLQLLAPKLPPCPVPAGYTEATWLRQLIFDGARTRYGPRERERVPGAYAQIERELEVIEQLGFCGYFLIVTDIVEFCHTNDIYCQGRGSAANSAVCYALGITNADAVGLKLLFERFLSPAREGYPDIDLDIESGRREEAIQHVYRRYGRHNAAQVANVITYRARSALRDLGRALGHDETQLAQWSTQVEDLATGEHDVADGVVTLAAQLRDFPRHLGIHSGGMVLCDRPVIEVCPVEHARMVDRTVLQWDKDDCATAGLVKFDLLGLGMLEALHEAVDLVADAHGVDIDLALIPQDDAVYDMLCDADSIGVFQVESRAQMGTLPRLRPRCFYDLVIEVALIRPGPIQGGSVHPYLRRRTGTEPVTYLHPLLEPALRKTLGVPLFQEQLMQIAIDVAGFSTAEADQLRQAMGSKRSLARIERLKDRLHAGMAARGVTGEVADEIYDKLAAFANFGFPESHAVSFAYLVYASAWIKLHYPAAFLASLLNAQPMGFWSPQTLAADARRHGVVVLGPDINASSTTATLEPAKPAAGPHPPGGVAVRLGLGSVRTIGEEVAERLASNQPFGSIEDVVHRAGLTAPQAEALAIAGAFGCFQPHRRKALWAAGAVARAPADGLPGVIPGIDAPELVAMNGVEQAAADLWGFGLMPDGSPTQLFREQLSRRGVITAAGLTEIAHGTVITVGGVVTHRQRPATAGGVTFVNLEDETGLINVICMPDVWNRVARTSPALTVRGRLERIDGVINVIAADLQPFDLSLPVHSRDFR